MAAMARARGHTSSSPPTTLVVQPNPCPCVARSPNGAA
jgi:hypothetical protein